MVFGVIYGMHSMKFIFKNYYRAGFETQLHHCYDRQGVYFISVETF